jgi:archaetidylinositol phosphate synthase
MRKPWDRRLTRFLIRPLKNSSITPNHITTLGLTAGLAAGALYATGERSLANLAGVLYMLSLLIDHADGELARLAGKSSKFGYYYDQIVGFINFVALFVGIGLGLRSHELGEWGLRLGIIAALSVVTILALRLELEKRTGQNTQPSFAGFEMDNIMYCVGPITWIGGLKPFLIAACIGAPMFVLWVLCQLGRASTPANARKSQPVSDQRSAND